MSAGHVSEKRSIESTVTRIILKKPAGQTVFSKANLHVNRSPIRWDTQLSFCLLLWDLNMEMETMALSLVFLMPN